MPRSLALLLFALLTLPAPAVTLAPLFQDGAILQRDKPIPVWGQADPGETVKVTFGGQTRGATPAADGRWTVTLDALPASATAADLVVAGKTTLLVHDVLVGEVWICSGQSNMEFSVSRASNFEAEKAAATDPLIREFHVRKAASETPGITLAGDWTPCSPETVKSFTAAGYFFARELRKALGVPVGIINTSYGGTPVESWMPEAALKSDPAFAVVASRWQKLLASYPAKEKAYQEAIAVKSKGRSPRKPEGPGSRMMPSGLFNAMVNPLIPYAVRGILWYQGEANSGRSGEYGKLFQAMITAWRKDFGQGDLPFYFVQLPNYERKIDRQWAYQREAQASALALPQTGMAVTIDVGEPKNLHPPDKQDVGKRLALIALAQTYGKPGEYTGPVFESAKTVGKSMRVTLTHTDGMTLKDAPTSGFELTGKDRVFHPATAKIEGSTLVITSPDVAEPVAVRYAFNDVPSVTLYNGAGLPAAPFRTDAIPLPPAMAGKTAPASSPETEATSEETGK